MHVLETPYQKEYARRRTGGSALAYLDRFGLLGPRMTIGHGVWMTEHDIRMCAESGASVCHNCSSNFRLKSGIAPVNRFLAAGIPVAIGIDEAGINDDRDILQEMRMVLRTHREPGIDAPHPVSDEVLRMATEHGAATTPFAGRIGRLSPGMEADLVLLDWRDITWPYQDAAMPPVDVLVHRAKTSAVKTVMVAGEIIYQDGCFTHVDGKRCCRISMQPCRVRVRRRRKSASCSPETCFRTCALSTTAGWPEKRQTRSTGPTHSVE